MDRPKLESVRTVDMQRLEQEHAAVMARLRQEHEEDRTQALQIIRERYREAAETLKQSRLPAIRELEDALRRDMAQTVRGRFGGIRYRELDRRLAAEKALYERQVAEIGEREQQESSVRTEASTARYRSAAAKAEEGYRERRASLADKTYVGDSRVENPVVYAFITVTNTVLGVRLGTLQFIFAFSLFLSVVVELGIWVAFENLTLAHLPIFMAEHEVAVTLEQKRAETEGELRGFKLDEELLRGKVRMRRENLERRMQDTLAEAE